jgi:hypothetical protein
MKIPNACITEIISVFWSSGHSVMLLFFSNFGWHEILILGHVGLNGFLHKIGNNLNSSEETVTANDT